MIKAIIVRTGKICDISGILSLQERNLYSNLSETDHPNGFVTTSFTFAQLEKLLIEEGIFVAVSNNKVVGYAMAGSWKFFSQWPIFPYMSARLSTLRFMKSVIDTENSFQYGPVCIDVSYRGSALFPLMFEKLRIELSKRYPIGITFINRVNQCSFAAHNRKLGMQVIDQFEFDGRQYHVLAFDTKVSVLISDSLHRLRLFMVEQEQQAEI